MNILHHDQEKDGVCHHMKNQGIPQLLFHRHPRVHGVVIFVIRIRGKDTRLPLKYFLDSVKLDLTTVLRMNIYSLTCRTSFGCPTDCCSWSMLKLFRRASMSTNMSHMRDN